MPTKQHLSLTEAAAATGRSYWRLRESILRGELKATQFTRGGKYYVKPDDLEAYFEAHTVSPLAGKVA
jgi:excisionase family DNA binding protein